MISDFKWKPDQCPHCGNTECDHISGAQGVIDASFRCSQCTHVFQYGEIIELKGPVFVRRDHNGTETQLSWARGWNRLLAFQINSANLFAAVLAGEEVRTKWAAYRLRGFAPQGSAALRQESSASNWRMELFQKLVSDCQQFGRTTSHTEELLENVVESIEVTTSEKT